MRCVCANASVISQHHNSHQCVYVCELTVWKSENSLAQAVEIKVSHAFLCRDSFLPLKLNKTEELVKRTHMNNITEITLHILDLR